MAVTVVTVVTRSGLARAAPTVARIEEAAREADGHAWLGEAVWRDLASPDADSAGFLVDDRAFAHVARSDNAAPRQWESGMVLRPDARDGDLCHELVARVVGHVAQRGGGRVVLWVLDAKPDDDVTLGADGFAAARDLYEMRVPLPLPEPPRWPAGVHVRAFEPGRDEHAWLAVNNRAFAGHPEQGAWTEATLRRRLAEPWFDPALLLLALDADGLAGFDWLKVHPAHGGDPRRGEIFVIGVDPRAQGRGLGRALVVGGLRAVHERGVGTGMLFCAAENEGALRLYRSLGFTVQRVDRAYEREVAPRASRAPSR